MTSDMHNSDIQFTEIQWKDKEIRLEYQWVGVKHSDYPVVVFLHEGLGSIALWKDFPEKFCQANGFTGLIFSRYGYGLSTPRPADEKWSSNFMHEQAHQVLPVFFSQLRITKPWLFGHSDGASIALLYASRFSQELSGIIVAAPHIFVENITIESIQTARQIYLTQGLRDKLSRYHADVDSAFWGWNDIWLDPSFRAWNIESELATISCPVLAIQGEDDEYGTLEQVYGIQKKVPATQIAVIPHCGHSPHRDQSEAISQAAAQFIFSRT